MGYLFLAFSLAVSTLGLQSAITIAIISMCGVVITGGVAYLNHKRTTSPEIQHTPATQLWSNWEGLFDTSERIRKDLEHTVIDLRAELASVRNKLEATEQKLEQTERELHDYKVQVDEMRRQLPELPNE